MATEDEQLRQLKYIRSNSNTIGFMVLAILICQVVSCVRGL